MNLKGRVAVDQNTPARPRIPGVNRHRHPRHHFRRQMRCGRSLIVQGKYGTLASIDHQKGEAMKKTLMALGAAAALTVSAVAIPAPAHAQRGVAAGVAAGLIGGAIIGGAIASQNGRYYGPGYYGPGYGGPAYVVDPGYGESCFWQKQRFWDGYGWRVRNVRVCD
jgi:hypothetical protein